MNKIITKFAVAKVKAKCRFSEVLSRFTDTRGEGHVDTAIKIIIAVVIGALVLAGLVLLWNSVIMPRLNSEIGTMFGGGGAAPAPSQ